MSQEQYDDDDDDGYYDQALDYDRDNYDESSLYDEDDLTDDHYVPGYDDDPDEYRESEVDRFYRTATVWQRLCSYEPSYIMRVEKYTQYILERHCSRYVSKCHVMSPAKPNVFRKLVFRIVAWLEFRVHNHLRKIKNKE